MHLELTGWDVAMRLGLTVLAAGILGANRGEHGRPAGLRTMVLVSVAAAVSMVLANLLLDTKGKSEDSFVQIDVMRLPLGVLTGVGFIGAGAILHKENLVIGVTTAATIWFVTMMGFCFGAGELGLGLGMLAIGFVTLTAFDRLESRWKQLQQATLTVRACGGDEFFESMKAEAKQEGYEFSLRSEIRRVEEMECSYQVRWHAPAQAVRRPAFLPRLGANSGVREVRWEMMSASPAES